MNKPLGEESDYAMLTLNGVFVLLVLVPVIEEFVFRGVFMFGKNRYWSMVYIPVVVFVGITLFKLPLGTNMIMVISLLVGMSSFLFYSSIKSFIRMNSLLMIVLMALLFSVGHIHNYETWDLNSYLGLLPRLTGGLFFGYAAVKYSLWAAMGFHFGNNLIVVLLAFLQQVIVTGGV
ncbi:CPBP family intramembrane metalloprotease [Litoribacter ruber]|uniref:CPBP family intramembrane glutamic endopeptidase n=1 Tax=Litoribacter ruber TaxID=702568 RepID=UPI001BD9A485|nr:CPBP family intramembrane glutamic endopeptidase [Litoribacter ruber]MBT0812274.1 CPBP family intramembrane metalloprotease [Litoribacter ruber]